VVDCLTIIVLLRAAHSWWLYSTAAATERRNCKPHISNHSFAPWLSSKEHQRQPLFAAKIFKKKISCQTTEFTIPMIHEQMDRNKGHTGWDANTSSNQRRGNVFEDIRADERVFQFIGSVNANITTAKSVSAKSFATQCLGDLSDPSLQQISSDRRSTVIEEAAGQSSTANIAENHGQERKVGTNQ
jgi:hypothetical protein